MCYIMLWNRISVKFKEQLMSYAIYTELMIIQDLFLIDTTNTEFFDQNVVLLHITYLKAELFFFIYLNAK